LIGRSRRCLPIRPSGDRTSCVMEAVLCAGARRGYSRGRSLRAWKRRRPCPSRLRIMGQLSVVRQAKPQTGKIRPPAFLVGDHLALDFLNSRSTPRGVWTEWLRDGEEFLDWLEQAGAINAKVASRFREDAGNRLVLDAVAERARNLREWLRGFIGRYAGQELP